MKDHYHIMQTFDIKHLPTLDVAVLGALELFMHEGLPTMKVPYKKPLVVGSGNAEATGKILFREIEAVFANESTIETEIKKHPSIDGIVLISASGEKHAPKIAKLAKKHKRRVTLITNSINSTTEKLLDKELDTVYILPKQREPYTYNTSTYLGMILSKEKEKPKTIHDYITKKISRIKLPDFTSYDGFYLIIPPKYSELKRMFEIKFIELFGRTIARDIETTEYVAHATTIVPSNELFISIGEKNTTWGKNRLHIPLPKQAGYASVMAIGYYLIGKIQAAREPVFKTNLPRYMKEISKQFKHELKPIVE